MTLLRVYVLREILSTFLVTLTVLTLLIVTMFVGKEAFSQGLGVMHVAQLVPYLLPNALLFAVPGTILFAAATVYGRMSESNEIVAIKSLGISPMVMIWPTLGLATLLSLLTVWLNDVAMTWGYRGAQGVVVNAVEDIIYGVLRTQRSYSTKAFSVNVKRIDGRQLIRPTFSFRATDDAPAVTITAEEAELRSDPGSGVLTLICRNGSVDAGRSRFEFSDTLEREISLDEATRKNPANESPSHMEMRVLPQRIAAQQAVIERSEQDLAAQTAYQLLSGDFGSLGGQAWSTAAAALGQQRLTLYRLKTEVPRRWANGFSCLCFTLVGAAVAIRRRTDALKSFFVCFLPILGVYYPLMMSSVDRAKSGAFPPYAVWLANVLLLLAGAWMLRKVVRY